MKTCFYIFVILLLRGEFAFSQKTAKGYYVSLAGDSVPVTFKIPRRNFDANDPVSELLRKHIDFFEMKEGVEAIDSSGKSEFLAPNQIQGFVFKIDSTVYKLFSKPVNEYHRGFLLPAVMGRRIRLFYYTIYQRGQPIDFPSAPGTPGHMTGRSAGSDLYFFTMEKYDRTYLFINGKMKKREIIQNLKDFFRDKAEMEQLIDKKLNGSIFTNWRKALKAIVEAYDDSHNG
jgi:hypothetical protein